MASKKKINVSFVSGNPENAEIMRQYIVKKFEEDGTLFETHYKFHDDGNIATTLSFKLNKPNKDNK